MKATKQKVVILPHQLNAVRNLCKFELDDDTEFPIGCGYVEFGQVNCDMSLRTFEDCLQWLHENENIYVDSSTCENVGTKNFTVWIYYKPKC
tara:strand:- start:293 stop:568 length:276 start_codon:yes stop_codon:yes gene_type:complete